MFDAARRIFDLLSDATLPPGEGDRLLAALRHATASPTPGAATPVTAIHVAVQGPNGDGPSSTRIPLGLVQTGLKFASMLPGGGPQKFAARLRAHGIDVDIASLTREQIEAFVAAVRFVTFHVPAQQTQVRISAE